MSSSSTAEAVETTDVSDLGGIEGVGGVGALRHRLAFVAEFVRAPRVVAAVAPSSKRLAKRMVEGLDFANARAVVEYGPGLGTFSRAVLEGIAAAKKTRTAKRDDKNGSEGCRFLAIERNERMATLFRQRHPNVILHHDDAANVRAICRSEGFDSVDYVVSGLGWPSFSDELRSRILVATAQVLKPGGEFRTFGYHCGLLMRGAWHFRRVIDRLFSKVEISEVVWGNMPPAFVYRCVK